MKELTLNEVISKYLEKGFGTMNKNDFEVWIFHYLLEHELQELFNVTKEIVDQVPSLKNNEALPVIISSNGKVTTKENCKNIYEPIMNFILAEYNKNKDK